MSALRDALGEYIGPVTTDCIMVLLARPELRAEVIAHIGGRQHHRCCITHNVDHVINASCDVRPMFVFPDVGELRAPKAVERPPREPRSW